MEYVPNKSEQAKQELMHFGVRGMRWGMRKADARAGLHFGVSKLSIAPGAKTVRKSHAKKMEKADARFEKYLQGYHNRYKTEKATLNKKLSEIKSGPESRWSKFLAKERTINEANAKYNAHVVKGENKYINYEKDRASRVKAKQDAFSNSLKAKMEAEIKDVTSKGSITDKIFAPIKIEMKYTNQLVEGLSKIDEEED